MWSNSFSSHNNLKSGQHYTPESETEKKKKTKTVTFPVLPKVTTGEGQTKSYDLEYWPWNPLKSLDTCVLRTESMSVLCHLDQRPALSPQGLGLLTLLYTFRSETVGQQKRQYFSIRTTTPPQVAGHGMTETPPSTDYLPPPDWDDTRSRSPQGE